MKRARYPFLNSITFIITIFTNYWVNSNAYTGKSVGEISNQYESLITPASYTFSIWGVIYLAIAIFIGYQWYIAKTGKGIELLQLTSFWLALANIVNAFWVIAWTNDLIGLSVVLILILLLCLSMLVIRLNLECWNAPIRTIALVWWPISIYLGWVILATLANLSAFFVSIGWKGEQYGETLWAIQIIFIAVIIYVLLIFYRNMRESAIIAIWGFIGISVKQWGENELVVYSCLAAALILLITIGIHGYKNRKTNPFYKFLTWDF